MTGLRNRNKTGKLLLRLLLCCMMLLMLTGCGAQETQNDTEQQETEEDQIQIAFLMDSFVIERWQRDRDVFVSTATQAGANVLVQNAGGDCKEQIEQIKYCIQKKVDAIVIVAVDCYALEDAVQEAKNAGIYVIAYDRLIMNAEVDYYITFDNAGVGRLMAENLLLNLPEGGKVIRINGSEKDNNVSEVRSGFYAVMAEHPEFEIVCEEYCPNWEAELAYDYMQDILDHDTEFDAVVCGNDDIASIVYRALSERGKLSEAILIGQDADLAACQRVVNGWQSMTVYKSVENLAREAANDVLSLVKTGRIEGNTTMDNGHKEVKSTLLDPVPVTRENLDEVIIDGGFHMRSEVYGETG